MVKRPSRKWPTVYFASITNALASNKLFYAVILSFIVQALWFASSDRYPMAFDENFHFGLIQLHANQWLPFFTHQPNHAEPYGAVVRDPSYLYHYLMSLLYRVIRIFTRNTVSQIIVLRLLNIVLFTTSFWLFRNLLLKLGSSRALTNVILLLFSLIPVVPFLAAQINYDNLLIPVLLINLLAVFRWLDDLRLKTISIPLTVLTVCLMMAASLIKYVFLPVMAVLLLVMCIELGKQLHRYPSILQHTYHSYHLLSIKVRIALACLLLICCGLFLERYAVNMVRYHSPSPDCDQILQIKQCLQFGPWQRDYLNAQIKPANFRPNYPWYFNTWIYGMWRRCFFAIDYLNENKHPLTLPGTSAAFLAIVGLILIVIFGIKIFKKDANRRYIMLIMVTYVIALFAQTFQAYIATAQPVAINGRYLIPFLPFLMLFGGLGFRELFQRISTLKSFSAVLIILLFMQGGGVLTFIFQSDHTWDWQNKTVFMMNDTARNLLRPIVYGSRRLDP